jgi:hypothetical protein
VSSVRRGSVEHSAGTSCGAVHPAGPHPGLCLSAPLCCADLRKDRDRDLIGCDRAEIEARRRFDVVHPLEPLAALVKDFLNVSHAAVKSDLRALGNPINGSEH